ncbi:MAG TPA: hypothetical protein VD905_08835, partial [Flavobacteriales bacterium]|nr:hypothetical protein [Flavobacteriales bacterium]
MLVVHWTQHNNIGKIISNGIKPSTRIRTAFGNGEKIKVRGVWCYPYTRNKTLNTQWKRNLKVWESRLTNFNGVVFRLTKDDFPLYAGAFSFTATVEQTLMKSVDDLKKRLEYFPPNIPITENGEVLLDITDFEIILPRRVTPDR